MAQNNDEVKVMDFVNEANEKVTEEKDQAVAVKKEHKVMTALKNLKPWQKVLLGVAAVAGAGFGGKVIFDAVKAKPEIITDVIETADGTIEVSKF